MNMNVMDLKNEHSKYDVDLIEDLCFPSDDSSDVELIEYCLVEENYPCGVTTGCNTNESKGRGEPEHSLQCLLVKISKELKTPNIETGQLCTTLSNRYEYFKIIPMRDLVRKIKDVIATEPYFNKYEVVLKRKKRTSDSDDEKPLKGKIKMENNVIKEEPKICNDVIVLDDEDAPPLFSEKLEMECGIKLENKILIKKEDPTGHTSLNHVQSEILSTRSAHLEVKTECNENDVKVKMEVPGYSPTSSSATVSAEIRSEDIKPKLKIKYENVFSAEIPTRTCYEELPEDFKKDVKVKLDAVFKTENSIGDGSMKTEVDNDLAQNAPTNRDALVFAEIRSMGTQTDNDVDFVDIPVQTNDESTFLVVSATTPMETEDGEEGVPPVVNISETQNSEGLHSTGDLFSFIHYFIYILLTSNLLTLNC